MNFSDQHILIFSAVAAVLFLTRHKLKQAANAMFLPEGFPESVSEDYVAYQIPDTLQGVVTYLKGILCTLSFLKGLGVGAEDAQGSEGLMAAVMVFVARDMTGMIAGLLAGVPFLTKRFSQVRTIRWYRMGYQFLSAIAGIFELCGAMYPAYFLTFVCISTALNALANVGSTCTRSALMTHFAKRGNFSDCAAKEGNQDRGVKVFGIILAYLFLRNVYAQSDKEKAMQVCWMAYGALTIAHLAFNFAAVQALKLETDEVKTKDKDITKIR